MAMHIALSHITPRFRTFRFKVYQISDRLISPQIVFILSTLASVRKKLL